MVCGGDVAGAAGAFGENADQPPAAQHRHRRLQGRPVRLAAAHRELTDPGQQPGKRAAEHLVLGQEDRTAPQHAEQQRAVDERAVVGHEHHRAGRRDPVRVVQPHLKERAEAPGAGPPGEVVQAGRRLRGQVARRREVDRSRRHERDHVSSPRS